MEKRAIITLIILIAIVIGIISLIYYAKANGDYNEQTMQCIAEKSKVIVSPTCSWCEKQKQDLGKYLNYFEFIDISQNPEILKQYDIKGTPSWIIGEELYSGYYSIEELKEITGC